MPGIDHNKQRFKTASRAESSTTGSTISLAAKKIAQSHNNPSNASLELPQSIQETKQTDQNVRNNLNLNQAQKDVFQKKQVQIPIKPSEGVSQYVAERRHQQNLQRDIQAQAQNINNANLGQVQVKERNPSSKTAAQVAHTSALVAQANLGSIDQDDDTKEMKEARKFLEEIRTRGGQKGQDFVAFATREIGKGRLNEIYTLIQGFHNNLKGKSLTPSEMIISGAEPIALVKNMVSVSNTSEMSILNSEIVKRSDAPSGFKLDQMHLRNLAGSERQVPPSFKKVAQLSQVEKVISFVSTINNAVLPAPWDKQA